MKTTKINVRKLVCAAMMSTMGYVLSTFVSFPHMAPFQSMMNVICAVMLGPWWAFASAFVTGSMRIMLNGCNIMALVGAIIGAWLAGFLFQMGHKVWLAYIGEIVGTGLFAAVFCVPLMKIFYTAQISAQASLFFLIPDFTLAGIIGGTMGIVLVAILYQTKAMQRMKFILEQA